VLAPRPARHARYWSEDAKSTDHRDINHTLDSLLAELTRDGLQLLLWRLVERNPTLLESFKSELRMSREVAS
jgi:hypothetical protein